MAILLIGSAGSGKSTLGNYLIDPSDEHMFKYPTFEMSKNNLPQTEFVQEKIVNLEISDQNLFHAQIIDTPGLNEGSEADLRHMIDVIEAIEKVQDIKACVFVVKFNAIIDAQYVTTIKYFRNLLPQLFENNVIVVMTEYCTDRRSEMLREMEGKDPERVRENVRKQVVTTGCLSYHPMVFMIDCRPVGELVEIEYSRKVRTSILSHIQSQQLPSIHVNNLRIQKTDFLKRKDERSHQQLEARINVFCAKQQADADKNSEILEMIKELERQKTETHLELRKAEQNLSIINTTEPVVTETHSVQKNWRMLTWLQEPVRVETPFEIVDMTYWTNGKCQWTNPEKSTETINGVRKHVFRAVVKGNFMRGLYTNVNLVTEKRIIHSADITRLQEEISNWEKELKGQEDHLDSIRNSNTECQKEIHDLQKFIEEKREEMERVSSDWMTIEEAKKRLGEECWSIKQTALSTTKYQINH